MNITIFTDRRFTRTLAEIVLARSTLIMRFGSGCAQRGNTGVKETIIDARTRHILHW